MTDVRVLKTEDRILVDALIGRKEKADYWDGAWGEVTTMVG